MPRIRNLSRATTSSALSPAEPAHRPYPAWWPWLVWLPTALLFTYAFFHRVAPSVMIDPLMRDLGVGAAVLGNLSALYFYAYAGLQIPVGMAVDRWGPRRVLTIATGFCALGSLCFSFRIRSAGSIWGG